MEWFNWSALITEQDNTVRSLILDSNNNELYVGGEFTTAGGITCKFI